MARQKAGREKVEYEITEDLMVLFYEPQTTVVIGKKNTDGTTETQYHKVGPKDGIMSRIWLEDDGDFYLDRECFWGFDRGGPWVREHRDIDELNEYLSIFGLRQNPSAKAFDISLVDPVNPEDWSKND